MTLLFYLISTIQFTSLINADVIWTSLMDGEGFSAWTIIASNNPQQKNNDNQCPDNDDCWTICGQDSNSQQAYIYRIAPTKGYKNIQLTFNIEPSSMSNSNEKCSLQYSINNQNSLNSFTEFFTATDTDKYIQKTVSLPTETWDNSNVGILIQALNGNNDCCYTSDVILSGDPFTYSPTPSPTPSPSPSPTPTPTFSPSTPSPLIYRAINPGTFNDNYELAPNRGWLINYSPTAIKTGPIITTSSVTSLTYHGPYIGDVNSTSREVYTLSQKFYCTIDSSVDITYYIYFCNTENSDTITLYLNNIPQVTTTVDKLSGTSYSDSELDAVSSNACVSSTEKWKYIAMGPYTLPVVLTGVLFEVKYDLSLNYANDAIAISRTQITCTPLPTISPTTSPTNIPTITPTKYPSISPTKYPSSVTINPTLSPSNNPTITPTNIPTITPTNNTSQTPTKLPTNMPTKIPTTPEPTLQIEVLDPTISPTFRPTMSGERIHTTNAIANSVTNALRKDDKTEKGVLDSVTIGNVIYVVIGIFMGYCCLLILYCLISKRQRKKRKKGSMKISPELNGKQGVQKHIQMVSTNSKHHLDVLDNGNYGTSFERINSASNVPDSPEPMIGTTNLSMDDVIDLHIASHIVNESIDQDVDNGNNELIHKGTNGAENNEDYEEHVTKGFQIDTESDEGTPGSDEFIIHGDDELGEDGYGNTKSYNDTAGL